MLLDWTEDSQLANIKVVASDMDCTLLADDGSMPPNMEELICALDDAGIIFCAASGRPSYTLREMFPSVIDRIALCSDNGAAITCRGKVIFKDLIDAPIYHELIDFTAEDGRGCSVVCGLGTCYILERDRGYDSVFRSFFRNITYLDTFDGLDAEVNKYTVFFPNRDAEEVYAERYRDAHAGRFSVTNAGKEWIDIMNKGVDKGFGIARLCEHLGCSVDDVMAFGDTYNDVEMLRTSGHSYVVANAEEHMHAHAKFLAPSNTERGVARVIERLLRERA